MKFLNSFKELYEITLLKIRFCKEQISNNHDYISKKYNSVVNFISSGSANSVIIISIIALTTFMITSIVSNNSVKTAYAKIQVNHIKLLVAKEETIRQIDIEKVRAGIEVNIGKVKSNIAKVKANAQRDIMQYQVRIEEARAAANPYIIETTPTAPVNVYIAANDSKYIIQTSNGATEIEISTIKVKGKKYSSEQRKLMGIAFHVGKEVGFPETIQALLLQETGAGVFGDRIGDTNLPMGKRSYGVMQMKAATARKVLKKYKPLVKKYFPKRKKLSRVRDEEIIIKLIQDDEFNIRLASLNFAIHRSKSRDWSQAVVAYNTGQGRANKISKPKKHIYYKHIIKRLIKEVRPFNKKAKLII